MRTIKFRVWDFLKKQYLDFTWAILSDNHIWSMVNGELYDDFTEEVVLEQYTGVDDADGGPIYEGDILQDVNDGIIVGAVTYDDKEGMYECNKNCMYDVSDCKVVGNIHMNPELLEAD